MSNSKPFKVECQKGSDSLIITFLGRVDTANNNFGTPIGFSLVLRRNRITAFEQLIRLDRKGFSLNDSDVYVVFSDYYNTFYEQDQLKVTKGNVKFSNVFNVCGVLYRGVKAIKLDGTFSFNVDSANTSIPVTGRFNFFMTPFDDEVLIGY